MFREVGPYHCANTGLGQRTCQSHYICIFVFRNIQLFLGEPKFTTCCLSTAFTSTIFKDCVHSRFYALIFIIWLNTPYFHRKTFNDVSLKAQCINIVLMLTLHTGSKYISNMWIGYHRVNINGNCDAERWHEIKSVLLMLFWNWSWWWEKLTKRGRKIVSIYFPNMSSDISELEKQTKGILRVILIII